MANNIETEGDWHWRNTMRPLRFFSLDVKAAAPLLFWFLHMRLWTLYLMGVFTITFVLVERAGYTVPAALRYFRSWLVGNKRPAWMYTRKRDLIDYG